MTLNDEQSIQEELNAVFNIPEEYKEEKEFRFVKFNLNECTRNRPCSSDSYSEIILGENISDKDQAELFKLVKENIGNIPIYKAIYNRKKKRYDFHKVS